MAVDTDPQRHDRAFRGGFDQRLVAAVDEAGRDVEQNVEHHGVPGGFAGRADQLFELRGGAWPDAG